MYILDKTTAEVCKESEIQNVQEQHQVQTTIKFEFIMDSLFIELFTGKSRMVLCFNFYFIKQT